MGLNKKYFQILTKFLLTISFFVFLFPIFNAKAEIRNNLDFFSVLQSSGQVQAYSTVYVNDPGFTLDSFNIDKQWGLVKAGFPEAWSTTVGSSSTTVAVIDTGLDATHEDLANISLADGYNFITNSPIVGRVNSDDSGHGTLVTGVLAASANNGYGIAGTNWQMKIMPIKVLDSHGKGDVSAVSKAIIWAVDHGAQIINLSFGGIGFDHDTVLSSAITYAFNKGAVIVAAGGNDVSKTGANLDQSPVFPICGDNGLNMIIGVAATDQNDLKADFSNYGKACIDVSAPGKRILSTLNYEPVTNKPSPNIYAFVSGTSLAAPFVSGEAALIWSQFPNLKNTQIRDRIIRSADNIDSLNLSQCNGQSCKGLLGSGRINVKKALDFVDDTPIISDGSLVKSNETQRVYQIVGGQKRPVSAFVQNQRYSSTIKIPVSEAELQNYPEGPYALPLDGTLVKNNQENTIYFINQGLKLPVTYQVFLNRNLSFNNVNTVSYEELASWVTGGFLSPADGTLVKAKRNKTIYWVADNTLHPISYNFYKDRGLNIFPVLIISDLDINNFPKGEAYIR